MNPEYKYDCPECDKEMEEVEFSDGSVKPDGFPGLLCFNCDFSISGDEELFDYLFNN